MKSKIAVKKAYEENQDDDVCNFESYINDRSDQPEKTSKNLKENLKIVETPEKHGKKSKSKPRKGSRVSTKDSYTNSIQTNHSGLYELVDSLKDKINIYEREIRNLIDEKVQMQMTINNLQMTNYRELRKSSKSGNSKEKDDLLKSTESIALISKEYIQEVSGIKKELKTLNSNIERQKQILDINSSLLDETMVGDNTNANNSNIHKNSLNVTTVYNHKSNHQDPKEMEDVIMLHKTSLTINGK